MADIVQKQTSQLSKTMKKIFLMGCASAVISIACFFASAFQYSFLKDTAADSVAVIDEKFIKHEGLEYAQEQVLRRNLARLRGGEAYLTHLHSRLWWLSVLGFGLLSVLSVALAVLANRKDGARTGSNTDPPTSPL